MVVIINGEVVPDNDPRAKQFRGSKGGSSGGGGFGGSNSNGGGLQNRGARVVSIGDFTGQQSQQQQQQQFGGRGPQAGGAEDDVDGLLTPLSRLLGIAGRRVQIPPIPQINFAGYSFPMIHLAVSLLGVLFMGSWRIGFIVFIALAIVNPK